MSWTHYEQKSEAEGVVRVYYFPYPPYINLPIEFDSFEHSGWKYRLFYFPSSFSPSVLPDKKNHTYQPTIQQSSQSLCTEPRKSNNTLFGNKEKYQFMLSYFETILLFCETLCWIQMEIPQVFKNNSINKLNTKLVLTKSFLLALYQEANSTEEIREFGTKLASYFEIFSEKLFENDSAIRYLENQKKYFLSALNFQESLLELENIKSDSAEELTQKEGERILGQFLAKCQERRDYWASEKDEEIQQKMPLLCVEIENSSNNPTFISDFKIENMGFLKLLLVLEKQNDSSKWIEEIVRRVTTQELEYSLQNIRNNDFVSIIRRELVSRTPKNDGNNKTKSI